MKDKHKEKQYGSEEKDDDWKYDESEIKYCSECGSAHASFIRLMKHLKEKHDKGLECDYCKKIFVTADELSEHVKKVHANEFGGKRSKEKKKIAVEEIKWIKLSDIQCQICEGEYECKERLQRHMEEKHAMELEGKERKENLKVAKEEEIKWIKLSDI